MAPSAIGRAVEREVAETARVEQTALAAGICHAAAAEIGMLLVEVPADSTDRAHGRIAAEERPAWDLAAVEAVAAVGAVVAVAAAVDKDRTDTTTFWSTQQ